jgi:drug/metabolite transporter (DMT)-like permease
MSDLVVVYGLIVAFGFGTSDFLSKGLLEEIGLYRTTIFVLGISGAFVLLPSLLLGMPGYLSLSDFGILALIACSSFVAFLLMYRGYSKGNLSIVSPTVNSFPVYSVVLSIVALRIAISGQVLLALGGVMAGILLVSTRLSNLSAGTGVRLTPGIPEAMAAAFVFAVAFVLIGYADETVGYALPMVSARIGGCLVGLAVGLPLGQTTRRIGGRPLRRVLAMSVLEASALTCFNLALVSSSIGGLPIVTTLAGMGVVFTVGFAKLVRKEPIELNHGIGIALLVASVAALLYLTA